MCIKMKLKISIVSKLSSYYISTSFETEFNPFDNIKQLIFLMDYCKPLSLAENCNDFFNKCEELFECSKGSCKIKELNLIPLEQNDYENFCLIDIKTNSYAWVKISKFIDYFSLYSSKEWLDFHYPMEQFFNDESGQIDETSMKFKKLIDYLNSYSIICDDELLEILKYIGI